MLYYNSIIYYIILYPDAAQEAFLPPLRDPGPDVEAHDPVHHGDGACFVSNYVVNTTNTRIKIYIYIYIERERERDRYIILYMYIVYILNYTTLHCTIHALRYHIIL